jgi:hypothetical protein
MDSLVLCTCGHALAQHDYDGCAGDRLRSCPCARDRHGVVYAAVEAARGGSTSSGRDAA